MLYFPFRTDSKELSQSQFFLTVYTDVPLQKAYTQIYKFNTVKLYASAEETICIMSSFENLLNSPQVSVLILLGFFFSPIETG